MKLTKFMPRERNPERSRTISVKSRDKISGKSRPEKSQDPGILKKSRPISSRIEIPENAGAWLPSLEASLKL